MAAALAVCIAAGLLAGCGNTEAEKETAAAGTRKDVAGEDGVKKTIVYGDTTFNSENEENGINPHDAYSGWACIRYGIGETLFHYNDNMEIEPWLAESYELVDETTWTIKLRDDVAFTSGRKMDGAAVKECLDDLITVHDRAPGDLNIASIEADGQTLTIKTAEPMPSLLNYLSDPYGCIIDMQAGIGEDSNVAATGPYMATAVKEGELDLVKNEDYWNGEPKIDEITVKTITDGDTMTMALQSGQLDMAYGLPYSSIPLFQNDAYTINSSATSRAFFAWMNFESPITQDPAVRKAIAYGINKEDFVNVLLEGNGYAAKGVFPGNFSFGNEAVTTEDYDPEAAKQVLEDAGWVDTDGDGIREKDGQTLTIRWLTYPSRQELPLLAESAQAALKEIGMDVQVNSTADHNSIVKEMDQWDIYASAMVTAPTGDPEFFFVNNCLSASEVNKGHYSNADLDELGAQMRVTFDVNERADLAVKMQQNILDNNAYVFAAHLKMNYVSSSKVTGFAAHPCDYYEITVDLDKE